MVPKEIFVLDELPKTGSGKIDRKGIRSAYTNE
jgi:acyl-coenzyme A synthetase/AMP-(fatty) acid ligase